jgi:hypothetical protein
MSYRRGLSIKRLRPCIHSTWPIDGFAQLLIGTALHTAPNH